MPSRPPVPYTEGVARLRAGEPLRKIAEEYGRSWIAIYEGARRHGWKSEGRAGKPISHKVGLLSHDQVRAHIAAGWSYTDIAERARVSRQAMWSAIQRYDLLNPNSTGTHR